MQKTVTINFRGVELEVTGNYSPSIPEKITADPYDSHPSEGGTFEVESVEAGGVEIIELLDQGVIDEIGDEAYTEAAENDGPDPDEEYDRRRDDSLESGL